MKKKRMGRPPLPASQRKSVQICIRFKLLDFKGIKKAAKSGGVSIQKFIRDAAMINNGHLVAFGSTRHTYKLVTRKGKQFYTDSEGVEREARPNGTWDKVVITTPKPRP